MNKDLILREYLAVERTRLANQTTLLAYIRTGLYFIVAGTTLGPFMETIFWKYMGIPCAAIGLIIIVIGIFTYRNTRKKINNSAKQIGSLKDDYLVSLGISATAIKN